MGPGTHVSSRVQNRVLPVNETDRAALAHDINYMYARGNEELLEQADTLALQRANGFGLIPMYLGLKTRQFLSNIPIVKRYMYLDRKPTLDEYLVASELKDILLTDPAYKQFHYVNEDFIF